MQLGRSLILAVLASLSAARASVIFGYNEAINQPVETEPVTTVTETATTTEPDIFDTIDSFLGELLPRATNEVAHAPDLSARAVEEVTTTKPPSAIGTEV